MFVFMFFLPFSTQAEQYQKKNRKMLVILILFVIVLVLIIILFGTKFKWSIPPALCPSVWVFVVCLFGLGLFWIRLEAVKKNSTSLQVHFQRCGDAFCLLSNERSESSVWLNTKTLTEAPSTLTYLCLNERKTPLMLKYSW